MGYPTKFSARSSLRYFAGTPIHTPHPANSREIH